MSSVADARRTGIYDNAGAFGWASKAREVDSMPHLTNQN
jgi:hypothetical protein